MNKRAVLSIAIVFSLMGVAFAQISVDEDIVRYQLILDGTVKYIQDKGFEIRFESGTLVVVRKDAVIQLQ